MRETWVWSPDWEDPLKEGMTTCQELAYCILSAYCILYIVYWVQHFPQHHLSGSGIAQLEFYHCREPAWGTLPMAKVTRKEAQHTQRRDPASGVPLEILEHLPPKPESAYFLLCAFTSDLMGGLPPLPLSEKKRVNLIKFLGVIVFQPTNSFGNPLACLNRFFRPHVIAQGLPTVRGMRCSKLPKYRFLRAVKRLIRNCIGEGFFTCWTNVCC